jgi:hypothetical protein
MDFLLGPRNRQGFRKIQGVGEKTSSKGEKISNIPFLEATKL